MDLTLILQAMFQVSLQDRSEGKVTAARVDEIIYEFHCSEKKKNIHTAIRTFVEAHHKFAKDNVVEKIQSLLKENEVWPSPRQQLIVYRASHMRGVDDTDRHSA